MKCLKNEYFDCTHGKQVRNFFYIKDFLFKDDIPYMVMTQHGDMLEWTDRFHKECFPFNPRESHESDYNFIKSVFK